LNFDLIEAVALSMSPFIEGLCFQIGFSVFDKLLLFHAANFG
jgi:hypothetical protein